MAKKQASSSATKKADRKATPMTDETLNAFLDSKLKQTIGFGASGDEISREQALNLHMYLNRPVGDEEEGRSKLQSSDIQDVIEAFLPASLAPFISSDKVVEFKPVGPEDEEEAEIKSLYMNHIFMKDNNGTKIQYTWQKDGLLQKNGFIYADWEERERTERKRQRVDYAGLVTLTNDTEIEVIEYAATDASGQVIPAENIDAAMQDPAIDPSAFDGMTFDIDYRRTWKEGRVKIQNIAPENAVVSNTAKDTETSEIIGFKEQVTISALREENYKEEDIDKISESDDSRSEISATDTERKQAQGGDFNDSSTNNPDPAGRKVWRTVVWTRVDFDGDGKTELRKIIRGGRSQTGGVILFNEEVDEIPVIDFTPIPMPHQLYGRAIADPVRSIQEGKTSMLRMGMDATYHTVYPRPVIAEDGINEDTYNDLLLDIPGAPIRTRDINAISYLRDAADIGAAYQMLEYFDRMREIRSPVTRQDQGVDSDVLNDKTASEARIQANASSLKKELVLRLYAEALGRLFRLMNRIVIKHQDKPRMLRLFPNRPPVEIDPRYWNADMDVSVQVGLGTGTKDQQTQSLMMIANEQKQLMAAQSPLVDWDKIYNTQARIVENAGLSSPEMYFNDPSDPEAQQKMQQQPQPPSPEEQAAQEEKQKEEAAKIEEAMNQRYEQGKAEGADMLKKYQIDKDNETKLALKDKEVQAKSADTQKMAEAASKPSAMVQIDGKEEISQIAQTIGASAIRIEQMAEQTQMMNMETVQTLQVIAETMKQTALIQAAPKVGTLPNGKQVTIQSVLPEQQIQ